MPGEFIGTELQDLIILSLRSRIKTLCKEEILRTDDLRFIHYFREAVFKALLWNMGVVKRKQFGK